jgi:hypothetical protein
MSQYVDLTLDRPRRFRFTPIDARNVCRYLNSIPGYSQGLGGPVTPNALLGLLGGRDFDAYASVMNWGLQHEDRDINLDKAMRLLNDFLGNGGSLATIGSAIVDAGINAGVWERAATNQESSDSGGAPEGNSHGSSPGS